MFGRGCGASSFLCRSRSGLLLLCLGWSRAALLATGGDNQRYTISDPAVWEPSAQQDASRRLTEGYRHLGCFNIDRHDRVMTRELEAAAMTLDMCYETCQQSRSVFFATQSGGECWCSSDPRLEYSRHGVGQCDHWCGGDGSVLCGGQYAADVYEMDAAGALTFTVGDKTTHALDRVLELHNAARCVHRAEPLSYDTAVAASAASYAQELANEHNCGSMVAEHYTNLGENVFVCANPAIDGTSCFSPEIVMADFYDCQVTSASSYDYGDHASRILRRDTTAMGCAFETCSEGHLKFSILVCHYSPPASYDEEYEDEVDPPSESLDVCGYPTHLERSICS